MSICTEYNVCTEHDVILAQMIYVEPMIQCINKNYVI